MINKWSFGSDLFLSSPSLSIRSLLYLGVGACCYVINERIVAPGASGCQCLVGTPMFDSREGRTYPFVICKDRRLCIVTNGKTLFKLNCGSLKCKLNPKESLYHLAQAVQWQCFVKLMNRFQPISPSWRWVSVKQCLALGSCFLLYVWCMCTSCAKSQMTQWRRSHPAGLSTGHTWMMGWSS